MKHISPQTHEYPWRQIGLGLSDINPIMSMMCPDESFYLHWLARNYYEGAGEIIDAGPLLGGSTYALASGLERNTRVQDKMDRIHTYDLFKYFPDFKTRVLPNAKFKQGDSLLPLFLENTKRYQDHIEVTAGDILNHEWTGQPIEILFIDLAKSQEINEHIVRQFFGCLIPNRSIVIQQDYFHYYCYWIHLTMQYLADYFEVIHAPDGGTLAFRCTKAIPPEVLLGMRWTNEDAVRLMDDAIRPLRGFWKLLVMTAKIRLLADLGEYEAGAALCIEIRESPEWDDVLLFDIEQAEKDIPEYFHYRAARQLSIKGRVVSCYRHGGVTGLARAVAFSIRRRLVG
jgi:hypothetical protein